jgi:glycosyltransferase involved in cell wall biosynthesis
MRHYDKVLETPNIQRIRVAVLFWRLGPYHHARLNAAAKLMDVFGVEACGMDEIYDWEKVSGKESFTRITLTERQSQDRHWNRELCRQMRYALEEIKPQLVVVPGWSSTDALTALSWCLETRTPAVMMSESTEWDERRSLVKEFVKRRLVRTCAAALVGGTPHKAYMEKLGLPPERIFLGYDAVDNEYFAKAAQESRKQKAESRKQHGLPENYFLASARFIEKKNLPRLIEAYARYRELAHKSENGKQKAGNTSPRPSPQSGEGGVPWNLVLLGDGPLKSDFYHLISGLGLQHSVLLPGFKQYGELPAYYGLASAFIHASTTEQWGLVVNEAMASGLPVLVSDRCGCATDLVKEGVNGFTFDPYNIEQLAQLMVRISAFSFPLSASGNASRELISHWGVDRFASGLKAAAETVIGAGRVKPTLPQKLILKALLAK